MIKRILEPLIKRYLSIFGGLLITGAKDVGKTEISKFFSKMI
jgi:AAA+ ATPase superfamily predicted ATPase